jgi:hypothetical protein
VAAGDPDLVGPVVVVLGQPPLQVELEPVELGIGDVVDHPGDGVRAVHRRGAAGDHVHPLEQQLRQGAGVDQAVRRGGGHAVPVEQVEGAQRAHVAQVQRRDGPGPGGGVADRSVGGAARAREHGHVRQVFVDRGRLGRQDLVRRDDREGRGRVVAVGDDPRPGDDDLLGRGGLALRRGLRLRRGADAGRHRQGGESNPAQQSGFHIPVPPPGVSSAANGRFTSILSGNNRRETAPRVINYMSPTIDSLGHPDFLTRQLLNRMHSRPANKKLSPFY